MILGRRDGGTEAVSSVGKAAGRLLQYLAKSLKNGASDGARTRDLRRDRPVVLLGNSTEVTTNGASDFALNVAEVETHLFGNITPRRTKRKRPKVVPAAVCEDAAYEELASSADAALSRLSDEITEVISRFRDEVAGWPGSDVDEVAALLERLDEELTAAVRRARREALW